MVGELCPQRETIDISRMSRADWLKLREDVLTASDVAAAAGVDEYKSRRYLYFEKGRFPGLELPPLADSGFMRRGRRMEPAVFTAVAEERPPLRIEKAHVFIRDTELRLGATPDAFIHGDPRGVGVLEAKTCMQHVFDRDWSQAEQRAPAHAMLQCLTNMLMTGAAFGLCAAIPISPYDTPVAIIDVPRHADAEQRVVDLARGFWDDVKHGREPASDYMLDRELIALLSPHETPDKTVDLFGDNEARAGLLERASLKEQIKDADTRCKAIEAMLMDKIGDAERVTGIPDFSVTWKTSHYKSYTVAERDTRVLRINDRRPNAPA